MTTKRLGVNRSRRPISTGLVLTRFWDCWIPIVHAGWHRPRDFFANGVNNWVGLLTPLTGGPKRWRSA